MRVFYLINIFGLLFISFVQAQIEGEGEFQRTFGGPKKDNSSHIIETADKGFISVGSTESFGAGKSDIYVVKMDALGKLEWAKTFGGAENDFGHGLDKTKDGNYVILGHSGSYAKELTDLCLFKIDIKGNVLWSLTYEIDKSEYAHCLKATTDGGFIVLAETIDFSGIEKNADVLVLKVSSSGEVEWSRSYGGPKSDYGYSIEECGDKGFVIGGETNSFGAGEYDYYLLKISKDGKMQLSKTYGDTLSDYGRFALPTSDGGYIIGGNTINFHASDIDFCIARVDKNGEPVWSKLHGGAATDYLLSMKILPDDGFVVCGYTNSFDLPAEDAFITTFLSSGRSVWGKTYGGELADYGVSFSFGNNGSIIMSGSTASFGAQEEDLLVVKTFFKRTNYDCNSHAVNPLITSGVTLKVSSGGIESDIKAKAAKIEFTIGETVTTEQNLCTEVEEE